MEHCQMITYEQLLEWQKQEAFQPLPVWLERNKRYFRGEYWQPYKPDVIEYFDDNFDELEDAAAYFSDGASYEIRSYNKSWRLWYACGTELPAFNEPWQLFSWDDGKGENAFV